MVSCPLAPVASASYPVLVHRPTVAFHASSRRIVTYPPLRFPWVAVTRFPVDLHLQVSAHAGRTRKAREVLLLTGLEAKGDRPGRAEEARESWALIADPRSNRTITRSGSQVKRGVPLCGPDRFPEGLVRDLGVHLGVVICRCPSALWRMRSSICGKYSSITAELIRPILVS
jgi:hypothetical protein